MTSWQQALYDRSPWLIKELLVGAEARRRNRYRRYGDYQQVLREHSLERYQQLSANEIRAEQLERLRETITAARLHTEFYRKRLPTTVNSLDDLREIPILKKSDIRENLALMIARDYNRRHLWAGQTSGSTGTPLRFLVGREGIRARTAIQDNYYASKGCHYGERRARFGGSRIVLADRSRPPFWIYNRVDNQLQMSVYHMAPTTLGLYIEELNVFGPKYITGYAHALYILGQHLCDNGGLNINLHAIFLDSEGIPEYFMPVIEQGFGTRVYKTYGIGETGLIALQASDGRYHVLELSCVLEVVNEQGQPLPYGETGRLIVTDLTQTAVPYIRYDTGDIGSLSAPILGTDMNTSILDSIEGRSDDFVLTPRGRCVGRLSYVTKPGRGILESQIVQTSRDRVVIRVVPTPNFDPTSMEEVIAVARSVLGSDMIIEWELVESIPRTSRHKFKHVVREF